MPLVLPSPGGRDPALDDLERWSAFQSGDTRAFEQLFRDHAPALCDCALAIVGDEDGARELTPMQLQMLPAEVRREFRASPVAAPAGAAAAKAP